MTTRRADAPGWLLSRRRFLALGVAAAAGPMAASARTAGDAPAEREASGAASLPAAKLDSIVSVAIHPGIGIARVGNSQDAFYVGPEVPFALPPAGTSYRDHGGALARQAARFRVYGYDALGKVVGELTLPDASIEWGVHLANRKAAWYRFSTPLDIPEAVPASRRNGGVVGAARGALVADAGLRSTREGPGLELAATVNGARLLLGEMLTDARGRLVMLPGVGAAQAWAAAPLTGFANNDGWLDDLADGPVTATVSIGARTMLAEPSWLVTAPPNFAPGLAAGWRTLHDVLEDTWVTAGLLQTDQAVSFQRHILPLFVRLAALQWVNAGVFRDHGWHSPEDLADASFLARLADGSSTNKAFRQSWARRFRDVDSLALEGQRLPPILGDAVAFPARSPRQWIGPTPLQHGRLQRWAAGQFLSDGVTEAPVPASLSALPLRQRPAALDRAALEACLGDAFHPGCEMTWPIRHASLWEAPYRLRLRASPEPDYGATLSPSDASSPNGPLAGSFPGSLTRWMAIPWQTDTVNCRSGYQPTVDSYLDTFWPARVPNQVLRQVDYDVVMDGTAPMTQRQAAFRRRKSWLRSVVSSDYQATLRAMVARWPKLGVIVAKPGPGHAPFPARFAVETGALLAEPAAGFIEPAPTFGQPDEEGLPAPAGTEAPPSPMPGGSPEASPP